jgi:hypothetical protein
MPQSSANGVKGTESRRQRALPLRIHSNAATRTDGAIGRWRMSRTQDQHSNLPQGLAQALVSIESNANLAWISRNSHRPTTAVPAKFSANTSFAVSINSAYYPCPFCFAQLHLVLGKHFGTSSC